MSEGGKAGDDTGCGDSVEKKYNVSIYKKDGRENLLNLLEVYCRLNVTFILSVCKWFE